MKWPKTENTCHERELSIGLGRSRKCKLGASVSCRSLGIRCQNMHTCWTNPHGSYRAYVSHFLEGTAWLAADFLCWLWYISSIATMWIGSTCFHLPTLFSTRGPRCELWVWLDLCKGGGKELRGPFRVQGSGGLLKCYEMLQNAMECYEMLCNAMDCYRMLWNATECYVLWNATEYYGMLRNAM